MTSGGRTSKRRKRAWTKPSLRGLITSMMRRPATISSTNALLWGVAWLIAGAMIGWHFSLVPTSLIGYTWGSSSLLWQAVYALTLWITSCVVVFAAALIMNRRVGVSELYGRMLFARWPIYLLMIPGMVTDRVAYSTFMSNPEASFLATPLYATAMMVVVVAVLLWYLYWGYCAFSRSTQRSGVVTFVVYLLSLVGGYYLSLISLRMLMAGLS